MGVGDRVLVGSRRTPRGGVEVVDFHGGTPDEWPEGVAAMAMYTRVIAEPGRHVTHYGEPVFHDDGSMSVEGTWSEYVPATYRMVEVGRVERPG